MANDKLTWTELRKAVAEYANTSEQEAGQFLNALLEGIVGGLKTDKQVKIKGLGSFTLKAVAPRKSVNIATGEAFTIEGYNKLTFSAEAMLKESVEKRLEQPKTEAVMAEINNDPIKKLGEQATEIVDILAELGQAVNTEAYPQPNCSMNVHSGHSIEPEALHPKGKGERTDKPEIATQELVEDIVEEPVENPVEEVVEEPVEEPVVEEPEPCCATPTKKKCNGVCWAVVAVLLAILIGAGIYFRETLIQWWQCMQDCQPTEELVEEVTEIQEVIEIPLAEKPREYVNFIGIECVGENSRLAWIAYKYYAQKDLWVFIYEANRDIIKHPAHVRPGQYIRIPELSEEYRNLYNPELKQLVDSLATEYLK